MLSQLVYHIKIIKSLVYFVVTYFIIKCEIMSIKKVSSDNIKLRSHIKLHNENKFTFDKI